MSEAFENRAPTLAVDVFVASSATVIGAVDIGQASSVWYGSVLRGDVGVIRIGARTNIQDLSVVHVTGGTHDTDIGDEVTVGHRVVLHGCRVGDRVLVGIGAIVLDGAEVEPECIIGAGALVTPGTRIPSGSLALGAPARVVRPLTADERAGIVASAARYVELAQRHAALGRT